MEASLQVHTMAKKLFVKRIAKEDNPSTIRIHRIKSECYTIAKTFYGEE